MKEKRWAFMSRKVIGPDDNPMLIRWRIVQTPWGGIYLHFIHREDLDRMPHDHPWQFWTLILRGSYTEEYWSDSGNVGLPAKMVTQTRNRFSWRGFPLVAAHRITATRDRVTTLVFVGPKCRSWGFYYGDDRTIQFIDWKDYFGLTGNRVW